MEKKIQAYLPYYLGCEVIGEYLDEPRKGYLTGVTNGGYECEIQFFEEDDFNVMEEPQFNEPDKVKLIVRRISSMSVEEAKEFFNFKDGYEIYSKEVSDHIVFNYKWDDKIMKPNTIDGKCYSAVGIQLDGWKLEINSEKFHYLLSKHFDLFGLIDAGLAIEKKL